MRTCGRRLSSVRYECLLLFVVVCCNDNCGERIIAFAANRTSLAGDARHFDFQTVTADRTTAVTVSFV